jgi:four helix bundle protein
MDFRFESLDIWKESIKISASLFEIAERAENARKFRFAEQLNGSVLGISNNIAEGSGATSSKEFARYLSIARSSLFETVNLLFIFEQRALISVKERMDFYNQLLDLSKKIYQFRIALLKQN